MQLALHTHCRKIHRPIFYINSPDDLITSACYVTFRDGEGYVHRPPGGPLHDFLSQQFTADNPPIILVNYQHFEAKDIVRFNSLLDDNRPADMTGVPVDALIIGLANTSHDHFILGQTFYSRFDVIETCTHTSEELLLEADLPVIATAHGDEPNMSSIFVMPQTGKNAYWENGC